MRRIALIGLLLASGACAKPLFKPGTGLAPPGDLAPSCTAASAQGFVGKQGDEVAEAARKAADADLVRVIRPGSAVTMDFRGDRLNLKLDGTGKVVAVTCG